MLFFGYSSEENCSEALLSGTCVFELEESSLQAFIRHSNSNHFVIFCDEMSLQLHDISVHSRFHFELKTLLILQKTKNMNLFF